MSEAGGLLVALLVLSYLGSALVGRRAGRVAVGSSGAEYVVLGVVVGPELLGVVSRELTQEFVALSRVGAAWLGLVAGLGFGHRSSRRLVRVTVGGLLAISMGVTAAAATWILADSLWDLEASTRIPLALGAAVVCSATAHDLTRRFAPVAAADGLAGLLSDIARGSTLPVALGGAVLLATVPGHGLSEFTWDARYALTLGTGVLLGLLASALLAREFRQAESWGILLGLFFLGSGIAVRVGVSAVALTFTMGLVIALVSRHGSEIRQMVEPTSKAVLLPIALLAGAAIQPGIQPLLGLFIVGVLLARALTSFLGGLLLRRISSSIRRAGPGVGFGLLTSSAFTLAVAVELNYALPSPVGPLLLVLAAASSVFGELFGSWQLVRSLRGVSEDDRAAPVSEVPSLHFRRDS